MLLIGDVLRRRARGADADRTALIFNEHRWSYRELDTAAVRLANGLRDLGIRRGDRVALLGRNSVEWVVAYFACAKAAAILVPVSYHFKGEELQHVLRDSGARVLVAATEFADLVAAERARATTLEQVVWIGEAGASKDATYAQLISRGSRR